MGFWRGIALPKQNLEGMQYLYEGNFKHCGLNYFGPGYWRGIACAQNYTMHV